MFGFDRQRYETGKQFGLDFRDDNQKATVASYSDHQRAKASFSSQLWTIILAAAAACLLPSDYEQGKLFAGLHGPRGITTVSKMNGRHYCRLKVGDSEVERMSPDFMSFIGVSIRGIMANDVHKDRQLLCSCYSKLIGILFV